jgi:signal transduction histidine kinase
MGAAARLSNELQQALIATNAEAEASELEQVIETLEAHARAVTAIASEAGSASDERLAVLRTRQVVIQALFVLVALAILVIAVGLSRRQLAASEEMRRVQERAGKQRAQFFANMSHELRTPLVAITGFASMIGIDPSADAPLRESARHIESQARDLLAIINNILDAAKLEAGRLKLELEDVRLADVVEKCVSRCRGLVGERPVELRASVPAETLVRADFVKLQQVLTNLIGNAIKFTERGSVTIRASSTGGAVELEVEDTGIGIAAEAVEHIWLPFQQASGAIDRKFGGTGLGLSIVRGLVEMMDGRVAVRSTPGAGSVFTVTLPAVERA